MPTQGVLRMSHRAERLIERLAEAEIDLLLVTALVNVRYLTGYTGSNGLAVIGPQTSAFVTDFRYIQQARAEVDGSYEQRHDQLELLDALDGVLPPGELRLGFEDNHMTVRQHARLRELLAERVSLSAAGGLVEELRAVKEPDEIERIRTATAVA